MTSWWWAGAIGIAKKKLDEDEGAPKYQSVTLNIGITSIVSNSLAEILPLSDTPSGPWEVCGIARYPRPDWALDHPIECIQCNVFDPSDAKSKLSPLTDITHIFYNTWVSRLIEAENCDINGSMLRHKPCL